MVFVYVLFSPCWGNELSCSIHTDIHKCMYRSIHFNILNYNFVLISNLVYLYILLIYIFYLNLSLGQVEQKFSVALCNQHNYKSFYVRLHHADTQTHICTYIHKYIQICILLFGNSRCHSAERLCRHPFYLSHPFGLRRYCMRVVCISRRVGGGADVSF